jgi:hypothetical protein
MLARRALASLIAILALTLLSLGSPASAQTPHSVQKTCGYVGGPTCPSTAVIITAWQYYVVVPPQVGMYGTVEEAMQAAENVYEGERPTDCSASFTTPALTSTANTLDGYPTVAYYTSNLTRIYATNSSPSCANSTTVPFYPTGERSVSCPTGDSMHYQASPLIGPYCTGIPNSPISIKQTGCPSCSAAGGGNSGGANAGSGALPVADPVDAANQNVYESEADYSGGGNDLIQFVRSYNSVGSSTSASAAPGMYLGPGWSATYFQYLLPVTVTDSEQTYNTVYAHRPDGRVLAFNEYDGVYSPDGDVGESLIQTSSGWQYQTADDTIETYNASGQLLSIARRGQQP